MRTTSAARSKRQRDRWKMKKRGFRGAHTTTVTEYTYYRTKEKKKKWYGLRGDTSKCMRVMEWMVSEWRVAISG